MPGWDAVEGLLVDMAQMDLSVAPRSATPGVEPMLVAFEADEHLLVAGLRDFRAGAYREPLIELLALAVPLGADRVALSVGGRVWSLEDPIPPVSPDGDMRQRAVVLTFVDGHGRRPPRVATVLYPFDLVGARLEWGDRHDLGRSHGGAVTSVLTACLGRRGARVGAAHADPAALRRQAERCERLGHRLWLGDRAARRILADILDERDDDGRRVRC